jgi:hypothetical protein
MRLGLSLCINCFASELCLSVTMLCSGGFVTGMKIKQCINLKFLLKLKKKKKKKTPTENFQLLKEVYGDNVASHMQIFERHKRFMEGQEEVQDNECLGCLSTSKTKEKVEKIIEIVWAFK